MSAMMLSGALMLAIGGFAVIFGIKPPYKTKRQEQNASMTEAARAAGKALCAVGAVLLVVGSVGWILDRG